MPFLCLWILPGRRRTLNLQRRISAGAAWCVALRARCESTTVRPSFRRSCMPCKMSCTSSRLSSFLAWWSLLACLSFRNMVTACTNRCPAVLLVLRLRQSFLPQPVLRRLRPIRPQLLDQRRTKNEPRPAVPSCHFVAIFVKHRLKLN